MGSVAAAVGGENAAATTRVVGLGRTATQAGNLIGFGLASALLLLHVPALGFALAALGAVVVVAMALVLGSFVPRVTAPRKSKAHVHASWRGLPWPLCTAAGFAGIALGGAWNAVAPSLAHPPAAFGGLEIAEALAAIGGGAVLAGGLTRLGTWPLLLLAAVLLVPALHPSVLQSLPVAMALFALAGATSTSALGFLSTRYRLAVRPENRASAMAAYSALAQATGLIGAGAVAVLGGVGSIGPTLAGMSGLLALAVIVAQVNPASLALPQAPA